MRQARRVGPALGPWAERQSGQTRPAGCATIAAAAPARSDSVGNRERQHAHVFTRETKPAKPYLGDQRVPLMEPEQIAPACTGGHRADGPKHRHSSCARLALLNLALRPAERTPRRQNV